MDSDRFPEVNIGMVNRPVVSLMVTKRILESLLLTNETVE